MNIMTFGAASSGLSYRYDSKNLNFIKKLAVTNIFEFIESHKKKSNLQFEGSENCYEYVTAFKDMSNKADLFLFDLLDEHYHTVKFKNEYRTSNYNFNKYIKDNGMEESCEIIPSRYSKEWESHAEEFWEKLIRNFGADKIVMNECYLSEYYIVDGKTEYFQNTSNIRLQNTELQKKYKFFKSKILKGNIIEMKKESISQKRGSVLKPYIYNDFFYLKLHDTLYNNFDTTMEYWKIPVDNKTKIKNMANIELTIKVGGGFKIEKYNNAANTPILEWTVLPNLKTDAIYEFGFSEGYIKKAQYIIELIFFHEENIVLVQQIDKLKNFFRTPKKFDNYIVTLNIESIGCIESEYISIRRKKKGFLLNNDVVQCFEDSESVKYLFSEKESKCLIVVFSGFNPPKTQYEFLSLKKNCKSSILYILDDYGLNGRFYQDKNGNSNLQNNISSIILYYMGKLGLKKNNLIFLGGSKGATSALYYGFLIGEGTVLAGCPPLYLDYYSTTNIAHHANFIMNMSPLSYRDINQLLIKNIKENSPLVIKFLCITNDIYYEGYFREFEKILVEKKINYQVDLKLGEGHQDVPKYLKKWAVSHLLEYLD